MKSIYFIIGIFVVLGIVIASDLTSVSVRPTDYTYTPSKSTSANLTGVNIEDISCVEDICYVRLTRDGILLYEGKFNIYYYQKDSKGNIVKTLRNETQIITLRDSIIQKGMDSLVDSVKTEVKPNITDIGGGGRVIVR